MSTQSRAQRGTGPSGGSQVLLRVDSRIGPWIEPGGARLFSNGFCFEFLSTLFE